MAWAALLVLTCLVGPGSETGAPASPQQAAPPAGEASKRHDDAAQPPATQAPPSATETQAHGRSSDETEDGWHEAPPSPVAEPGLVDPWASVPLQRVTPKRPLATQPVAPRSTSAPLLDPWAGTARQHVPHKLHPELRDPFHGMQPRHAGPRLARADLRDPFARRPGSRAAEPAAVPTAVSPEPATSLHPDLRDPFGRRKPRPAPALPEAAPAPAPPATVDPRHNEPSPRSGALLPSAQPFAHLPRAHRPT